MEPVKLRHFCREWTTTWEQQLAISNQVKHRLAYPTIQIVTRISVQPCSQQLDYRLETVNSANARQNGNGQITGVCIKEYLTVIT